MSYPRKISKQEMKLRKNIALGLGLYKYEEVVTFKQSVYSRKKEKLSFIGMWSDYSHDWMLWRGSGVWCVSQMDGDGLHLLYCNEIESILIFVKFCAMKFKIKIDLIHQIILFAVLVLGGQEHTLSWMPCCSRFAPSTGSTYGDFWSISALNATSLYRSELWWFVNKEM